MRKEEIRKEFFKLRIKGNSYANRIRVLKATFGYEVSERTLQRWNKRLNETAWNLKDKSTKPNIIHRKITFEIELEVIKIRKETGWGERKIVNTREKSPALKLEYILSISPAPVKMLEELHLERTRFVEVKSKSCCHKTTNKSRLLSRGKNPKGFVIYCKISHSSAYRILRKNDLTNVNENRRKRIKYIRWQREHPNSLWQMDVSDQKIKGKYCFAVIDDCSRYCLGLFALNNISTTIITHLLDELIKIHGKPREVLTDNGNVFGLRSKHSRFDRWCNRRIIKHIRTAIHSPTTTGKIERFFQTLDKELMFCKNVEHFRMRYNHFRPHSSLQGKHLAGVYFAFSKLF